MVSIMGSASTIGVVRVPAGGGLELVYGDDERSRQWAADRIGRGARFSEGAITIGVERRGRLCAVAVFNLFTDTSCHAHIATDRERSWANRSVLAALFAYPFEQCGLRRITLPIAASNRDSIILAIKLGFQFEGRLIDGCGDDDEIILGMLAESCPWLR